MESEAECNKWFAEEMNSGAGLSEREQALARMAWSSGFLMGLKKAIAIMPPEVQAMAIELKRAQR